MIQITLQKCYNLTCPKFPVNTFCDFCNTEQITSTFYHNYCNLIQIMQVMLPFNVHFGKLYVFTEHARVHQELKKVHFMLSKPNIQYVHARYGIQYPCCYRNEKHVICIRVSNVNVMLFFNHLTCVSNYLFKNILQIPY